MVLESLKSNNKRVGIKQTIKSVENGTAKTVFVAKDAEEKVVAGLKELCKNNSVDVIFVDSMKQLGKACGIEVGAAAVCLLK